jgi:hypothetical protein
MQAICPEVLAGLLVHQQFCFVLSCSRCCIVAAVSTVFSLVFFSCGSDERKAAKSCISAAGGEVLLPLLLLLHLRIPRGCCLMHNPDFNMQGPQIRLLHAVCAL